MKAKGKHRTITYTYLYFAAFRSYEEGLNSDRGSFYFNLNSIVMSAFSFEAFMNHCGKHFHEEELLKSWDEFKWKKSLQKFDIITALSNLKIDKSTYPYQSIPELIKLRNSLAHGETETVYSEVEFERYEEIRDKLFKPKWVEKCNSEQAKRFLEDVREMISIIHRNIFESDDPFAIMSEGFYGVI